MGYIFTESGLDEVLQRLAEDYLLFAPTRIEGGGAFSDTDLIRYQQISRAEQIVLDEKSAFSFKEALLPLSETLFYFTEDRVSEASPRKKGALVFLRSCDLHAVRRLDEIYLNNGAEDYYYSRLREGMRFALIGCGEAFDNCFCVDMGTNRTEDYHISLEKKNGEYLVDDRAGEWAELLASCCSRREEVVPPCVTETETRVAVPENLTEAVYGSKIWDEYDSRCINCGRCNFVCPTCTCFTMQDIFYTDNGRAGERRRVMASCMVDGFTDVAGGGAYRRKNGERMRFKVLHKVHDFNRRFGYHMCVGCGRCDDICPEYISFSGCINKLGKEKEAEDHEA